MSTVPLTRQEGDAHHNVTIKVEGEVVVFANLLLNERLADVNNFSFIWKNEINDSYTDDQEEFIEKYIGKIINISFDDDYSFKGIITHISYNRNDGLTQEFSVSGSSTLILLNDKVQSASYYKKTLKEIITDCIQGIPSNVMGVAVSPRATQKQFYRVQYNETDFSFIRNLAVRTGEWFFYNGEKLKFGPIEGSVLNLKVGIEIFDPKLATSIKPFYKTSSSYDEYLGEVITSTGQEPKPTGILEILTRNSTTTYGRKPKKPTHQSTAPTASVLEAQMDLDVEGRVARMTTFSGNSYNAKIKLGSKINVQQGNKNFEYIVIQIQHSVPTRDSYGNSFVAIPSSVKVPPYTDPSLYPTCDSQIAIVKENEDKDGLDRIKVHFPWQDRSEMTPWIRIQNPYAGGDKGFRFVPEKNEEVMIGFESRNAERPYVIGAMYNGAGKSGHSHEGNNVKIFRTKSGCRLMMNDNDGSVKFVDKAGSYIKLDGSGNITISASGDLKIEIGGNSDTQIGKDGTFTIGQNLTESIGIDKSTTVGGSESKTVGQNVSMVSGQNLELQTGQKFTLTAGMDIEETAGMGIKQLAGTEVSVEGGVGVKIKGGTTAEIASPMTTVKGDGITTIKGGLVMIN